MKKAKELLDYLDGNKAVQLPGSADEDKGWPEQYESWIREVHEHLRGKENLALSHFSSLETYKTENDLDELFRKDDCEPKRCFFHDLIVDIKTMINRSKDEEEKKAKREKHSNGYLVLSIVGLIAITAFALFFAFLTKPDQQFFDKDTIYFGAESVKDILNIFLSAFGLGDVAVCAVGMAKSKTHTGLLIFILVISFVLLMVLFLLGILSVLGGSGIIITEVICFALVVIAGIGLWPSKEVINE